VVKKIKDFAMSEKNTKKRRRGRRGMRAAPKGRLGALLNPGGGEGGGGPSPTEHDTAPRRGYFSDSWVGKCIKKYEKYFGKIFRAKSVVRSVNELVSQSVNMLVDQSVHRLVS